MPCAYRIARRYAIAILVVQVGWIGRLFLPDRWGYPSFGMLVLLEVLSPMWAERVESSPTTSNTPWHPEHIAERYGLFTIIVLGECILSAFGAINGAFTDNGVSGGLIVIAVATLVTMFGLWWSYFRLDGAAMLAERPQLSFLWGYVHYGLFASIAAFGAGIAVVAEWSAAHDAEGAAGHVALSDMATAMAVGIPVGSTLLVQAVLHGLEHRSSDVSKVASYAAVGLVLAAAGAAGTIGVPAALVVMAAVVSGKVAIGVLTNPSDHIEAPVHAIA